MRADKIQDHTTCCHIAKTESLRTLCLCMCICSWLVGLFICLFVCFFSFFLLIHRSSHPQSKHHPISKRRPTNVEDTRWKRYNRNDEEKSPMSVIQFKTCCLYVRCQLQIVRRRSIPFKLFVRDYFYFGLYTRTQIRHRCIVRFAHLFVCNICRRHI